MFTQVLSKLYLKVCFELCRMLINYVENSTSETWEGVFIAVLFFLSTLAQSLFSQRELYIYSTLEIRIRAALIAAVYRKTLSVKPSTQENVTTGEIFNLISTDVQRVVDCLSRCWIIWSAPLQVVIAVVLIYRELGAATFVGLLLMVCAILLNAWVTRFIQRISVCPFYRALKSSYGLTSFKTISSK